MDRHRGHGAESDQPNQPDGPNEYGGCAAFGPLLEAYHHHALPPEQAQSVAEHAAGCARCQAALADFAAMDRLIAAAPTAQPGPELRRRLMARIAAASMPFERDTVVNDTNDTTRCMIRRGRGLRRQRDARGRVCSGCARCWERRRRY